MSNILDTDQQEAISASWRRCERQHGLSRETDSPILRMQSSEISPRRDELVDRAGGRMGIFQQVAEVAAESGQCFSIADTEGILVRVEGQVSRMQEYAQNGIALGSCWDERISGTNGVSMVMARNASATVIGEHHFFTKLNPFVCTSVPLVDARNQTIGIVNLAAVDRGRVVDYLFAKQLLESAADRIQRILFQRHFQDHMLVSMSSAVPGFRQGLSELVAVDAAGLIVGSTSNACHLTGVARPADLHGRPFEAVFDADAASLHRFPERPLNVRAGDHAVVHLAAHAANTRSFTVVERRVPDATGSSEPVHDSSGPTLRELAVGSSDMGLMCARAESLFERALPFLVEGETGTGKTALVAAILIQAGFAPDEVTTIDCAVLSDSKNDREYIRTLLGQARISTLLGRADNHIVALVFDNIDEMPNYAQAELRNLLEEAETASGMFGPSGSSDSVRVLATSQEPLIQKVERGGFREDLYYMLANNRIALPPVRQREGRRALIAMLVSRMTQSRAKVSDDAMAVLCGRSWFGNVRQLRSALLQAIQAGDGEAVSLDDLFTSGAVPGLTTPQSSTDEDPCPGTESDHIERTKLLDALVSARWNVSLAAKKLRIGRATIHRKMKRYSISRPS